MQTATFFQRFGANGDGYLRPGPERCAGRVVCVDCPRDHHSPPFLPFRLPVHVRLHRERFPDHAIRYWCWTHYRFEEEGDNRMTQPYVAPEAGVGACLRDNQLFVVKGPADVCFACGRPPDHVIPFPPSADATLTDTPSVHQGSVFAEGAIDLPGQCPDCGRPLTVRITDTLMEILPAGAPPPVDGELASPSAPPEEPPASAPDPGEAPPASVATGAPAVDLTPPPTPETPAETPL